MYIVRWKDDQDYFDGDENHYCWVKDKKEAKLFPSKEEARKAILKVDPYWDGSFVVEYMHPLNLNPPKL